MFPLFRDREELPGAAELGTQIRQALEESLYVIVICSPRAASSPWVNREVQTFKELGREDRVLCLIVDGEPNAKSHSVELECFPQAVRYKVDKYGELTGEATEPIAADARAGKDGKANARLKLLSGMLGVGFDELHQRERQRSLRRRIQLSMASLTAAVFMLMGYVALADVGVGVPRGGAIRTIVDRFDASVFRVVPDDAVVRRAARDTRQAASTVLLDVWKNGNRFVTDTAGRKGHPKTLQVWDQSQALSGLLRSPDLTSDQLNELVKELGVSFDRSLLIEARGKKYGFLSTSGLYTQAETTMWNVIAISIALGRPGLIVGAERELFEERLSEEQSHLTQYWDPASGGWNTFPDPLEHAKHETYTAALALLTLLEVHEANLPWMGDSALLDRMLAGTTKWLISQWNPVGDSPGWRGAADDEAPVSEGLTLQIYSELLRAEAECGLDIPSPLLAAIPRHLLLLTGRSLEAAPSVGRFTHAFINHEGQALDINPSVNYLWHPWAVHTSLGWLKRLKRLKRLERHPGTREHLTQIRRVAGYLIVNLGRDLEAKIANDSVPPFMAAETIYAYSRIPLPELSGP